MKIATLQILIQRLTQQIFKLTQPPSLADNVNLSYYQLDLYSYVQVLVSSNLFPIFLGKYYCKSEEDV